MEEREFERCIRRIQRGDKEGLKAVYEAYIALIYSEIYNLVGRKEDAEDITSEFFLRLWKKADSYRFGKGHRVWLVTIARNMAIDFLRKQKREVLTEEIPEENTGQKDFSKEVVGEISIEEAMGKLKPKEHEVLDLKIFGEFTFQEIAKMTETPMGTVTWLYRQAIEKLRRCGYE